MRRTKVGLLSGFVILLALSGKAHAQWATLGTIKTVVQDFYQLYQIANTLSDYFDGIEPTTLDKAVTELEAWQRGYRDQDLVNRVNGDLNQFRFIASNWQSALTDDLEANFITSAIADLAQLRGDMQDGTIDDYYLLMPAYNTLTIAFVGAIKAFGEANPANAYPQSTLDQYLQEAAQLDYQAVGAYFVNYDIFCPGCSDVEMWGTQGGKAMWPRYTTGNYQTSSQDGIIYCDFRIAANTHRDSLQQCYDYAFGGVGQEKVTTVNLSNNTNAVATLWSQRQTFAEDQAVQVVDVALQNLTDLGYGEVFDYSPLSTPTFPFGFGHIVLTLSAGD